MGAAVPIIAAVAGAAKAAAPIISAASGIVGLVRGQKQPELPAPPPPVAAPEAPPVNDPSAGALNKAEATGVEQQDKLRALKRRRAATQRGKLASRQDSGKGNLLGS
jgi:hypothetical protein